MAGVTLAYIVGLCAIHGQRLVECQGRQLSSILSSPALAVLCEPLYVFAQSFHDVPESRTGGLVLLFVLQALGVGVLGVVSQRVLIIRGEDLWACMM